MNKIREKRKEAKLSQKKLAKLCGWSSGRLCNYEKGRRSVRTDDARKIVVALRLEGVKCTVDELFPPSTEVSN